jgi:prepilin-type N-terminal cleavage/methylation domain-containing protein
MAGQRRPHLNRGFTLIELLIVVLMIGVLATLVIPKYRQAEMKAQGADVTARVEAINVALKLYESDHDSLPSGTGPSGSPPSWLANYVNGNQFAGPQGITYQYARSDILTPATLLITAGTTDEAQILLAAAGGLGNNAVVLGGGTSLLVTLTQ